MHDAGRHTDFIVVTLNLNYSSTLQDTSSGTIPPDEKCQVTITIDGNVCGHEEDSSPLGVPSCFSMASDT